MFAYYCKRCEVSGQTELGPRAARCWCCDRGDELTPQTFSLSVRASQGQVVSYYSTAS
jgi:hypothetical protein